MTRIGERLVTITTIVFLSLVSLVYPNLGHTNRPPPSPPIPVTPTPSPMPAIVALSIGDSLTFGTDGSVYASYRAELSRLTILTGQPHQWKVAAVGGTKCGYWATQINSLITSHQPGVIFLNCGTNDTPQDSTEADYRTILSVAQTRGVPVVASLIGIPDMRSPTNSVRPYIIDWMHATNLAIKRALVDFPQVPVADFQRIPANPEWLQADGIHFTARAEAGVGQLFYQAAQSSRSWKTFAQMRITEMCGLSGVWRDDPWLRPDIDYHVCRS